MTDATAAAARARGPQALWAIVPCAARGRHLRRAAQALLDELDELAELLAGTAGVPRTEALLAELLPTVAGLRSLADDGPEVLADRRLGRSPLLRRAAVVREPVGVVGILGGTASPWGEPALEVAAAVLAGNGVVLASPAADALVALMARAGIPEGLVAPVDARTSLAELEAACDRAWDTEPEGPKASVLVLDGAPVERAVDGALWAGFARAGRGPAAVGRVVAVSQVAEALTAGLHEGARRLRLGDPLDPRTEVGPLDAEEDVALVAELVDEAVAGGAELLCGGPAPGDRAFAPAVLRGVAPDARLLHEPVPGPVLAVLEAADESAAIELARGAAPIASVWTADRAHGERVARALGAERAWVNDHGPLSPAAPARLARHVSELQLGSSPTLLRSARWLPYDPALVRATTALAHLLHGRESDRLRAARSGALPLARVAARLAREAVSARR